MRRYPYIIVPLDAPTTPIPADAIHLEALVFAPDQYPPEKVLADYCARKELRPERFKCHAVVFTGDLREGKGGLFVRRDGDGYRMGVNWRR